MHAPPFYQLVGTSQPRTTNLKASRPARPRNHHSYQHNYLPRVSYTPRMHDPFILPPIPWLSKAVQPFSDYFSLTTLPLHIHEVLGSFLAYTFINVVFAPWISNLLFPVSYAKLSKEKKINWNVQYVKNQEQGSCFESLKSWITMSHYMV